VSIRMAERPRIAWNALPVPSIATVVDAPPGTPQYQHVHKWMRRTFPLAGRCEWCATTARRTSYANARSDGYTYNRADWLELCYRCHVWFDKRTGRGEANARAKLTEDDVRTLRALRAGGRTTVSLADEFNISHVMVSRIALRKAWRHI
jgi:hypothetical protein